MTPTHSRSKPIGGGGEGRAPRPESRLPDAASVPQQPAAPFPPMVCHTALLRALRARSAGEANQRRLETFAEHHGVSSADMAAFLRGARRIA